MPLTFEPFSPPQDVDPEITCQWSVDHDVLYCRIGSYKHAALDAWSAMLQETIRDKATRPKAIIHEFLKPIAPAIIPYLDQKTRAVTAVPIDTLVLVAVVIPNNNPLMVTMAGVFVALQQLLAGANHRALLKVFFTMDEVRAWLLTAME